LKVSKGLYKTAALRLHPDKNTADAEKFKTVGAHKAWVEALTEAQFATSSK
jgi:DnaJ-class molecular chaperone